MVVILQPPTLLESLKGLVAAKPVLLKVKGTFSDNH